MEVAGIDHVCLGTDTKLTPSYRPAGGNGPRLGGPGSQAGGAPGSRPDGPPPGGGPGGGQNRPRAGERTNQIWPDQQAGFYYAVVEAMLKTGFTPEEIGKVGGGNFCRVFDAATASHR